MVSQQQTEEISTADTLRNQHIVCFSHDWSGDPLSKTHLVRVLSRDNKILWINAIANRMPTASSKDLTRIYKKLRAFAEPVKEVEPNIFVLNPLAIPAYGSEAVRAFNQKILLSQIRGAMRKLKFANVVNLIFNPAAGLIAGKINEDKLIYYCVDEYTAFTGASKGLKEIEDELFKKSDLVIVSAEKLLESKGKLNPRTFLIRHGVDYNHFAKALRDETKIPDEIKDLPKPIIGFHGLLADWVDFELLAKTAEHFKTGSLVLVGKISVDGERRANALKSIPNVHFLGRKPYAELPAFCKGFAVALNPFAINELTLAANPLKVREYLAAGVPVVATAIPEVEVLGSCRIGRDHADFINQIEQSLASGEGNQENRRARSLAVQAESWDARVEELRKIVAQATK